MTELVADTSSLVSLGIAAGHDPDPLTLAFAEFDVSIPETVVDELRTVGSYDDEHGRAAQSVLTRIDEANVHSVQLDETFPLEDGENAAVTLANDVDARLLLCDEFTSLGLVHASLADTRLVTTPTLLSVLVRDGALSPAAATSILETIERERSWESNSYVQRARRLLDDDPSTD